MTANQEQTTLTSSTQVAIHYIATILILNTLAVMIPVTPGNAGTFELAVSTSLAAFAVGRSDAVLFAIALHIIDLVPIFLMGYVYLGQEKVSIRQIKAEHLEDMVVDRINEDGDFIENRDLGTEET